MSSDADLLDIAVAAGMIAGRDWQFTRTAGGSEMVYSKSGVRKLLNAVIDGRLSGDVAWARHGLKELDSLED